MALHLAAGGDALCPRGLLTYTMVSLDKQKQPPGGSCLCLGMKKPARCGLVVWWTEERHAENKHTLLESIVLLLFVLSLSWLL
jgi:hypothetical protein